MAVRQLSSVLAGGLGAQVAGAGAELGIPDILAERPADSAEVARRCGTDPDSTRRLLAGCAAVGLVELVDGERFALTSTGRALTSDHPRSLRSFAVVQASVMSRLLSGTASAVASGGPADRIGLGESFYDYLGAEPQRRRHWLRAMTETAVIWFMDSGLLDPVAWDGARLLVDVGGGEGGLSAALLARHGGLSAVVTDTPGMEADACRFLAERGLTERARFAPGDARREVPGGGDVYLLARVLSNHGDVDAQAILSACRVGMGSTSRLVMLDSLTGTAAGNLQDVLSMCIGGRARSQHEWAELLDRAGLRLVTTEVGGDGPWARLEAVV